MSAQQILEGINHGRIMAMLIRDTLASFGDFRGADADLLPRIARYEQMEQEGRTLLEAPVLDEMEHEMLRLRFIDRLSYRDIGECVGYCTSQAQRRAAVALEKLDAYLEGSS